MPNKNKQTEGNPDKRAICTGLIHKINLNQQDLTKQTSLIWEFQYSLQTNTKILNVYWSQGQQKIPSECVIYLGHK